MGDGRRTPDQILGPFFPQGHEPTAGGDLTSTKGRPGRAHGETVEVKGRIVNRDGRPVRGARLIVWQANSFGRYAHANDPNPAPLDPSFIGFAEFLSDQDGAYRFKTVKPGAYPAGPDWMRPPHIHFEVHGRSERLITQMYFAGELLNASDPILMSASRPDLLIAVPLPLTDRLGHRASNFDIVLSRG
jgi:protocatechuate 3,4-dioxygenase beta subunit